jgi:hypothetical protein
MAAARLLPIVRGVCGCAAIRRTRRAQRPLPDRLRLFSLAENRPCASASDESAKWGSAIVAMTDEASAVGGVERQLTKWLPAIDRHVERHFN